HELGAGTQRLAPRVVEPCPRIVAAEDEVGDQHAGDGAVGHAVAGVAGGDVDVVAAAVVLADDDDPTGAVAARPFLQPDVMVGVAGVPPQRVGHGGIEPGGDGVGEVGRLLGVDGDAVGDRHVGGDHHRGSAHLSSRGGDDVRVV